MVDGAHATPHGPAAKPGVAAPFEGGLASCGSDALRVATNPTRRAKAILRRRPRLPDACRFIDGQKTRRRCRRPKGRSSFGARVLYSTRRCPLRVVPQTLPPDYSSRRPPCATSPDGGCLTPRPLSPGGTLGPFPRCGFKPRCEHSGGRPSNDRSPLVDASAGRVNRNRPVELQRKRPTVDGTHNEFRRFGRGLRGLHRVADPCS